jgi:rRNA-processing protein EBP2
LGERKKNDKMVKKSKLLAALDAHKGRDFDKERQKKLAKAAEKRKSKKQEVAISNGEEENEEVYFSFLPLSALTG